ARRAAPAPRARPPAVPDLARPRIPAAPATRSFGKPPNKSQGLGTKTPQRGTQDPGLALPSQADPLNPWGHDPCSRGPAKDGTDESMERIAVCDPGLCLR